MGNIGFPELVAILAIAMLLFGANRIPEIGRSLGQAISEFKKGMSGEGVETVEPRARNRRGVKKDA
ncbi:MAG: twin-arginine translocase TatA/TatE family subunit [Candidatus Coatesbacteria bacterium]